MIHLPRHLRKVHKKTAKEARVVKCNFSMRKRKNIQQHSKRLRLYQRRQCSFPQCYATVVRIHNHLRNVHQLDVNSTKYKRYLKESFPCLEDNFHETVKKMPTDESDDNEDLHDNTSESDNVESNKEVISGEYLEGGVYDSEEDEDFIMDEESVESESAESSNCDNNCTETELRPDQNSSVDNDNTNFILKEFSAWLESCDGGEKKEEGIQQQISQVLVILKYVDPKKMAVASLMSRVMVRNMWLTPFKNETITKTGRKRQPGTIRSYCNSLRLFTEFLEISKIEKELQTDDIRAIQTQARAWSRCLRKHNNKREFEKIYEDHELITTPEEVQMFAKSQPCRDAINLLEKFSVPEPGKVPTQNEYTNCRDFLLWHLSIDNGGRPGQFVGLTISDFEKARKSYLEDNDAYFVINVFDHKTADTHGPARVVFSAILHSWFRVFIFNIRKKVYGLPTRSDSPIFVTHTGNAMKSKNISGRLCALWTKGIREVKSGGGGRVKMNNTLIRKSIQTFVRKNHKEMKEAVSSKLLHHEKTAERYYNVIKKGEEATQTSKFISGLFKRPYAGTSQIMPKKSGSPNEGAVCTISIQPHWSEDQVTILYRAFEDTEMLTMDSVRVKLNNTDSLAPFKDYPKKVIDKLRYMRKCAEDEPSLNLDILPNEETMAEKMARNGLIEVSYVHSQVVENNFVSKSYSLLLNYIHLMH